MLRKLLFWSLAVVFPFPLVQTYDSVADDPGPLRFYVFLGLIAYTWWLLSIVLGVPAVVAACTHREYSYAPTRLARNLDDWAFYGALTVLCFAVFFMSG
ncbi:hypothetical protein ACWD3I_43955 [Streptomyces sp. NPDC002817]|uniref:hypothetical protein n=1 Tax=Streptomyces sp. NPDC088357 TaxID=3154655 RepID=UPI00342F093E